MKNFDKHILELKEKIDGLKNGEIKPSQKRLEQARQMAKHYNSWNTGEKGYSKRMNDNATVVLAQQLEALATEILLQPVEQSVAASILIPATDVMPGHDYYAYSTLSEEGIARPISNYADDVNMVSMDRDKIVHKIIPYGAGFTWSVEDIERAVFFGMSLPADGAQAARRMWERGLDQCLSFGEAEFGIQYGLANQPLGTGESPVRFTTSTSGSWQGTIDSSAAAVMYGDLCALVAEHDRDGLELYPATHLLLPPGAMHRIRQARLADNGATVLEAFNRANPEVQVRSWSKLGDVDDNGSYGGRALLLCNRADVAQSVIAKDFTLQPPQPVNLAFKIVGSGKTAGAIIKTRIGMRYLRHLPSE
jgi:hypothetical protein